MTNISNLIVLKNNDEQGPTQNIDWVPDKESIIAMGSISMNNIKL